MSSVQSTGLADLEQILIIAEQRCNALKDKLAAAKLQLKSDDAPPAKPQFRQAVADPEPLEDKKLPPDGLESATTDFHLQSDEEETTTCSSVGTHPENSSIPTKVDETDNKPSDVHNSDLSTAPVITCDQQSGISHLQKFQELLLSFAGIRRMNPPLSKTVGQSTRSESCDVQSKAPQPREKAKSANTPNAANRLETCQQYGLDSIDYSCGTNTMDDFLSAEEAYSPRCKRKSPLKNNFMLEGQYASERRLRSSSNLKLEQSLSVLHQQKLKTLRMKPPREMKIYKNAKDVERTQSAPTAQRLLKLRGAGNSKFSAYSPRPVISAAVQNCFHRTARAYCEQPQRKRRGLSYACRPVSADCARELKLARYHAQIRSTPSSFSPRDQRDQRKTQHRHVFAPVRDEATIRTNIEPQPTADEVPRTKPHESHTPLKVHEEDELSQKRESPSHSADSESRINDADDNKYEEGLPSNPDCSESRKNKDCVESKVLCALSNKATSTQDILREILPTKVQDETRPTSKRMTGRTNHSAGFTNQSSREGSSFDTCHGLSMFDVHRYERPTVASRLKRVDRRVSLTDLPKERKSKKEHPFVVATGTSPSHNVNLALRNVDGMEDTSWSATRSNAIIRPLRRTKGDRNLGSKKDLSSVPNTESRRNTDLSDRYYQRRHSERLEDDSYGAKHLLPLDYSYRLRPVLERLRNQLLELSKRKEAAIAYLQASRGNKEVGSGTLVASGACENSDSTRAGEPDGSEDARRALEAIEQQYHFKEDEIFVIVALCQEVRKLREHLHVLESGDLNRRQNVVARGDRRLGSRETICTDLKSVQREL